MADSRRMNGPLVAHRPKTEVCGRLFSRGDYLDCIGAYYMGHTKGVTSESVETIPEFGEEHE